MKKTILFLIGLVCVSVNSLADTRAQALLLHNGQGRSFDADLLQQAVNEAVAGDTIYLSEGTFNLNGTLIINKDVSLIGADGEKTILRGSINFAIDGEPTISRYLLDALKITNSLEVSKVQHGLHIRKCWIGHHLSASADVTDLQIDRCYVDTLLPVANIKSASVVNSVMAYVGYQQKNKESYIYDTTGNDWYFLNCSIAYFYVKTYVDSNVAYIKDANLENSIVWVIVMSEEVNTFTNCLTPGGYGSGTKKNCYVGNFSSNITLNASRDNYPSFIIGTTSIGIGSISALESRNYYGTDGTVVGALGGATPFTLTSEGIGIRESVLKVDPVTRQLNVTLKVE